MIAPARMAAFRALRTIIRRSVALPDSLHRVRADVPDRRDRALLNEIVTGTLRWLNTLDHLIVHFADRPLLKLNPVVRDVLRISIYQLIHLDRVPPSAVVNDAVNIIRTVGPSQAAGLTNAVLRALLRALPTLPLPEEPKESELKAVSGLHFSAWPNHLRQEALRFISISHSHPAWLAERWLERYGYSATLAWAKFNNEPARLTLRANTLHTTTEALSLKFREASIVAEPLRYGRDGLNIASGRQFLPNLTSSRDFYVQAEASQLIPPLIQAEPGMVILDACAAPGGKTLGLASAMANQGILVAGDFNNDRLNVLAHTVSRQGASVARMVAYDLSLSAPFGAVFDRVLVDVPCSGLGTVQRDPDIRWRRQSDDIQRLAERQLRILRSAATTVRTGGRLLYTTCSSEPEENERVIEAFLGIETKFRSEDLRTIEECSHFGSILNEAGYLRSYPHLHGLDAFFAASLRRM